jgi:hypothetical protein
VTRDTYHLVVRPCYSGEYLAWELHREGNPTPRVMGMNLIRPGEEVTDIIPGVTFIFQPDELKAGEPLCPRCD